MNNSKQQLRFKNNRTQDKPLPNNNNGKRNQHFDNYLQGCKTFKTLFQLQIILSTYKNQELTEVEVRNLLRRHGIRIHHNRYVCWEKLEQAMKERK